MKFAVAFDHAGVPFRELVMATLSAGGHEPVDLGEQDDYPDVAVIVGRAVASSDYERGVLVCGSGAGVAVAACKLPGIRAAVGHEPYTASQMVTHDDCNVLCLGARVVGPALAELCVAAFAQAVFSGEERHVRRLGKVMEIERGSGTQ